MYNEQSWDALSKIVYKRTYSRKKEDGTMEAWPDTVDRVIRGNTRLVKVDDEEKQQLREVMLSRKGIPAGRGLWQSGTETHKKLGGISLGNCYAFTANDWEHFVIAMDYLMLGGGVGLSVEHKFVTNLPKVKKNVQIEHKNTLDAAFIVPDSREGWCELFHKILESFFVTGKSFSYSTKVIRGAGEPIVGFGGLSSGPIPLINFVEQLVKLLQSRAGKHIRPIDAGDILCLTGQLVVSGNVRRSAIILIGDPFDKEYLSAKRWSLGNIPNYRAFANYSVNCSDIEDLHPLFWKTYEDGEPFGLCNIKNVQSYGRMGESPIRKDYANLFNPCGEANLENGEQCNLVEIPLMNLANIKEFVNSAKLLYRYAKRVTCESFHNKITDDVVKRNRRIGEGITGCLASPLFKPEILDEVYKEIRKEDFIYSHELNVPESISLTVAKPSGTVSKLLGQSGYEGIHPAYSRYFIQRIRFSSNDPLIPELRRAGHHIEPQVNFDGTLDHSTLVVDFYVSAPKNAPVADEDWTTWKQLDTLLMVQKYWADQAVSVTVYYKKEEIPELKVWLQNNLQYLKSISFLCHSDHGFKQAPKEACTKEYFEQKNSKLKPLNMEKIEGDMIESLECVGGVCPTR